MVWSRGEIWQQNNYNLRSFSSIGLILYWLRVHPLFGLQRPNGICRRRKESGRCNQVGRWIFKYHFKQKFHLALPKSMNAARLSPSLSDPSFVVKPSLCSRSSCIPGQKEDGHRRTQWRVMTGELNQQSVLDKLPPDRCGFRCRFLNMLAF